ncbi:hypothetical protein ACFTUC_11120 [Streptomyces sp. NPDC056944]|uniref:hypothetical protein n=1 Tax=Streptomyces sp. NPDC056944 TaxID=3345972 RepID=UPI003624AD02
MTITTERPSAGRRTVALGRGFLTGGVIGMSPAALVVGTVVESVPLFVAGLAVPLLYGLLLFLAGAPRRAREAAAAPRTALALIEDREAVVGETSDVPVRFELTVAPDDAPPFRVTVTQDVHVVDLPDHRPGGVVVVEYPPDRPWRVRIVQRPTPEWEERAAGARLDSEPGAAVVAEPPEGTAVGFVTLLGLVLGATAVILLFRADLFGQDAAARPPATPQPAVSSTSWTVVVSSASGSVALGPGRSFLDEGELRRAVDSLTGGAGAHEALTVVVQERLVSVVFAPAGARGPRFDPRSLPFERIPALVEEARTTLGVPSAPAWQLTADRLTGSLTLKVAVTGPEGPASLEADGQGKVVRRTPAR